MRDLRPPVRPLGRAVSPRLQRGPIGRIDPGSGDFWDDLLNETEKNLVSWLNAHHFQAIEQFSDDMSTSGGADAGEIAASSFIDLVSAIPVHGNLASGLLNMVKPIYEGITADDPMKLTANPDGIIAALTSAYGEDTPLELLPVQMVLSAYVEKPTAPGEPRVIDRRWGAELVNRGTGSAEPRSSATWLLGDGDPSFLQAWTRERPRPTVKALVPEGLWN